MQIDDDMLVKLEKLSALKISQQSRGEVISQLSRLVDFVDILNELDLDDNDIAVSTIGGKTPFREDLPSSNQAIEIILNHAPKRDGRYFEVPKIIE